MRLYIAVCTDCDHHTTPQPDPGTAQRAGDNHNCPARQHRPAAPVPDGQDVLRLAHWAARDYQRRCPSTDYDDLVSDAMLGIAQAVTRWDPAKGTFSSYAGTRAKGAILDGVRERGTVSRSKFRQGHREQDLPQNGRCPVSLQGMQELGYEPAEAPTIEDTIADQDAVDRLLDCLDPRARYIVEAHDLHGYRLAEIGQHLGITESRVCQLRTRALKTMRDTLAPPQDDRPTIDLTRAIPRQRTTSQHT